MTSAADAWVAAAWPVNGSLSIVIAPRLVSSCEPSASNKSIVIGAPMLSEPKAISAESGENATDLNSPLVYTALSYR